MDLFGVGSMFGALADGIVGGLNYQEQKDYNKWAKDFSERNFQFQQQQYEEQKQREDTAVQRRAADLEKAGFNKLMAAGQGANAGSTVGTVSPGGQAPQLQLGIQQSIDTIYNALSTQQNIAQSQTQEKLIESQILGQQEVTEKIKKEIEKIYNDMLKTDAERNKIISDMMKTDAERLRIEQQRQIEYYNYLKSRGQGLRTTDGIPSNITQAGWIAGSKAAGN